MRNHQVLSNGTMTKSRLGGNKEFVQKHPVVTKRVLRAILKAADLCASEPAGMARQMVESIQQKYCDHGRSTELLKITWPTFRARSSWVSGGAPRNASIPPSANNFI